MIIGMTDDHAALFADLEAFFAWDVGATDSGKHDPDLRARRAVEFDALRPTTSIEGRRALSEWVRTSLLSDEAIEAGYGWEDALVFLKWIDEGGYRSR